MLCTSRWPCADLELGLLVVGKTMMSDEPVAKYMSKSHQTRSLEIRRFCNLMTQLVGPDILAGCFR
jgi:hypothetical protein